jgi:hypothetical protein
MSNLEKDPVEVICDTTSTGKAVEILEPRDGAPG